MNRCRDDNDGTGRSRLAGHGTEIAIMVPAKQLG
jgi:hypothetical protein